MFRRAVIIALTIVASGVPAFAEEATPTVSGAAAASASNADAIDGASVWIRRPSDVTKPTPRRPASLPVLYGTLAALQAYDGYSTMRALNNGAHEANGVMTGVTQHTTALWAVKTSAAAVPMILAEHLWRQNNRVGAVVVMVVANGVMAAVAANNAQVLAAR